MRKCGSSTAGSRTACPNSLHFYETLYDWKSKGYAHNGTWGTRNIYITLISTG
jgi:hypothetical protein